MEVAPLIFSRTGQCDYNSKFAVRPKEFSEIQWARSKILAATRNISRFNGIRRIVAAKNGICIAGIVCTMKYFVNNCLPNAEKEDAQPYSHIRGTLYGVFLGYSFKGNANEIPDVNYSDLWQWFKEYLTPEWEKKSAQTVKVDYFSWGKVKTVHVTNHGTEFYDSAAFNEEILFDEYLARALMEEVAFCSNVENIQAVEDGIYTAVTTSASNVDKLKANMERKRRERKEQEKKTSNSVPQEQFDNTIPSKQNIQSIQASPNSQSSMLQSILQILSQIFSSKWFWIVLVFVFVIILFV
ncbi:MAG: hypothetical protein IKI76_09705 [Selenomonadaceae bacterium]|nr:hypothetical protein [Selenomonadaceae bacterium]